MAETNPEKRLRLKDLERRDRTQEKKWRMWQYLKAVVELKNHRIRSAECIARMSFWSGLEPEVCAMMLSGLRHESVIQLSKARPNVPDPPSVFPDDL